MTNLAINPEAAITIILFLISFVSFIFVYNKAIKNRVDKTDLNDLKNYVDQQDRSVHHRIDEVNTRVSDIEKRIENKLDYIINKLIK